MFFTSMIETNFFDMQRLKEYIIALHKSNPITKLQGSHSVTCYPTQVNAPHHVTNFFLQF